MIARSQLPAIFTLLVSLSSLLAAALPLVNPIPLSPSPFHLPTPLRLAQNAWKPFTYPLPSTQYNLKGHIITTHPLHPSALHHMLSGGIATTQHWIALLGSDTHLRAVDNPYLDEVPGCHFTLQSLIAGGGGPMMTYGMVLDVLRGLEVVLEKAERNYEAGFVVMDDRGFILGHGEVSEGGVRVDGVL